MKINHIKFYKDELPSHLWDSYTSMEHAQVSEEKDFVLFHTVPQQTSSEVYTVSSFAVDKHHPLLWHLDEGVQEEHMLDMSEVLEELQAHPKELAEFTNEVDTSADNCLLLKAW